MLKEDIEPEEYDECLLSTPEVRDMMEMEVWQWIQGRSFKCVVIFNILMDCWLFYLQILKLNFMSVFRFDCFNTIDGSGWVVSYCLELYKFEWKHREVTSHLSALTNS